MTTETTGAAARPALSNLRGGLWLALSIVSASAMTLGVRGASAEISSQMIVMLRGVGGLALAFLFLAAFANQRRDVTFKRPWLHVARGALIAISTHFGFWAITQMPLATATVLFFSGPIFTTMMAPLVLGEKVGLRRGLAVLVGFIGVMIVARPGSASFDLAAVAALGSSFLFSLVLLMSRAVATADGPWAAYVSSAVMTIILSLPVTVPIWHLPVSTAGWWLLALVALTSLIRNIGDIQAYRYGEASFLAPFAYTRIVIIASAAYLLFDETPDFYTVLGGAVIISSAIYIALRERRLNRERARLAGQNPN